MELDTDGTEYVQLEEDTDEVVELRHEDLEVEYLGMPRREVGGLDMRCGTTEARTVDLMGLEAEGSVYAWSHMFDADLDLSHATAPRVYLRSTEGQDLHGYGLDAGTTELSRSDWGEVDLSGADIGRLRVKEADVGTIDLSGAYIEELDADADHGFVVDEETEIGTVPEGLEGLRVYEETTERERDLLRAADAGEMDALMDDPAYRGATGSLRSKDLLREDEYSPSLQGEELLEYL